MQATIANEGALSVKVTHSELPFPGQQLQSSTLRQSSPRTAFQTTVVFKQGMTDQPPQLCCELPLYHLSAGFPPESPSADDCFKPLLSLCQGAKLTNHLPGLAPTLLRKHLHIPPQKGSEVDQLLSSLTLMMYTIKHRLVIGYGLFMLGDRRRVAIL